MNRRDALLSLASAPVLFSSPFAQAAGNNAAWESVRNQFELEHGVTNLNGYLGSANLRPVRLAEAAPATASDGGQAMLQRLSAYLRIAPENLSLAGSTTEGLGLIYAGLKLAPGEEVLSTEHEHACTREALRLRTQRHGAQVRLVRLYNDPATADANNMVRSLINAVRPNTRALALTWVHGHSGVKLPVRQIADELSIINARRAPNERVLLILDAVLGLGVENADMGSLGADFVVSSTHKFAMAPMGAAVIAGTDAAFARVDPVIPATSLQAAKLPGKLYAPGAASAVEKRRGVQAALDFHASLGKVAIEQRIHNLAQQLKQGLAKLPNVRLITPLSQSLSSGIVSISLNDFSAKSALQLLEKSAGIRASLAPSPQAAEQWLRFGPTLLNSEADMQRVIAAVAALPRR